jgi:hypothetical protein
MGVTFIDITIRNYLIAQADNFKITPVFNARKNNGY